MRNQLRKAWTQLGPATRTMLAWNALNIAIAISLSVLNSPWIRMVLWGSVIGEVIFVSVNIVLAIRDNRRESRKLYWATMYTAALRADIDIDNLPPEIQEEIKMGRASMRLHEES